MWLRAKFSLRNQHLMPWPFEFRPWLWLRATRLQVQTEDTVAALSRLALVSARLLKNEFF